MAVIVEPMDQSNQDKILDLLAPRSELFRLVALDVIARISVRIHSDGQATDGSQIGTYSEGYMKVRSGSFANTARISRGANKGKQKKGQAGTTTRGANAGQPRTSYNRGNDTKVVISLTRQLENDYAVVGGDVGWGVGFKNAHNYDKAVWNNTRYGDRVYGGEGVPGLTADELEAVELLTADLITKMSA